MIEISTNTAATSLWDTAGGPAALAAYDANLGLSETTPSTAWGLTTTVPLDQLRLLRALVTGDSPLTAQERSYALGLMERVTTSERWGVSSGVPATATVALKNGWLPLTTTSNDWQINSIGWVTAPGHDYLIAVMTTGNPTMEYGIATIDGLSQLVYQGLSS
jgi:beta-lactamase class A